MSETMIRASRSASAKRGSAGAAAAFGSGFGFSAAGLGGTGWVGSETGSVATGRGRGFRSGFGAAGGRETRSASTGASGGAASGTSREVVLFGRRLRLELWIPERLLVRGDADDLRVADLGPPKDLGHATSVDAVEPRADDE
jgi:hypothetical protein